MLSPEQQAAVEAAARGHSLFLTGGAGTGKSFTLQQIIAAAKRTYAHRPGAVAVVAPTGVAAVQVEGTTIHSWRHVQVLIIDEISMVPDWLLDLLDRMGRETPSSSSNGKSKSKPFGGIQVILCGDFLQLPPVAGAFCFKSNAWKQTIAPQHCFELGYAYRQGADVEFASLLSEIRLGKRNDALLDALRQSSSSSSSSTKSNNGIQPTRLYSKKMDVHAENMTHLNQLPAEPQVFAARDVGPEWAFDPKTKKASTWTNAAARLTLKVDAQVVLLKNLDVGAGLVNGARGVVTGFSTHSAYSEAGIPVVRFACGITMPVSYAKWTLAKADHPNEVVATRFQVPLDLAWAITIHKSQGMSLDLVETDLSECFDFGMAYVALSRYRTLKGLTIKGLSGASIKAHAEAVKFHEAIRADKDRPHKRCKSESTDHS
jgi:ATP-dependent DNA helicase PIF1